MPQGPFIVLSHCLLHGRAVNIFDKYCIATWPLILKEHSLDECSKSGMRGHALSDMPIYMFLVFYFFPCSTFGMTLLI